MKAFFNILFVQVLLIIQSFTSMFWRYISANTRVVGGNLTDREFEDLFFEIINSTKFWSSVSDGDVTLSFTANDFYGNTITGFRTNKQSFFTLTLVNGMSKFDRIVTFGEYCQDHPSVETLEVIEHVLLNSYAENPQN